MNERKKERENERKKGIYIKRKKVCERENEREGMNVRERQWRKIE